MLSSVLTVVTFLQAGRLEVGEQGELGGEWGIGGCVGGRVQMLSGLCGQGSEGLSPSISISPLMGELTLLTKVIALMMRSIPVST